jgi:hypothetical protein
MPRSGVRGIGGANRVDHGQPRTLAMTSRVSKTPRTLSQRSSEGRDTDTLSDADLVSLPYQRGDGTAVQAAVQSLADRQRFTRSAARSPVDHPPPGATAAPRMNGRSSGTPGTGRCGCRSQRSKGPPGHAKSPRRSTAPEAVTRGQGRPASAFFQHRCGGRFDSGGGSTTNQQLRPGPAPGLLHARRASNRHLPEICQETPSVVVRTRGVAAWVEGLPPLLRWGTSLT